MSGVNGVWPFCAMFFILSAKQHTDERDCDHGSVLFYVTRDAYNEDEYRDLGMFKSIRNTDRLVEARVRTPDTPYDTKVT